MSTSGSTKKPDVAPSNKQDLMPARELFYPNDPLVGSLLSLNPFALFGWLMLAAVVLILFAKVAGVFSIPLASGNVGFWYSYNWSLMYLLHCAPYFCDCQFDNVEPSETHQRRDQAGGGHRMHCAHSRDSPIMTIPQISERSLPKDR